MILRSYLQHRNRDAYTKNGLGDMTGKVKGRTESCIDMYVLPRVKHIASGKLLCNRGNPSQCSGNECDDLEGCNAWGNGRSRGRGYILTVDSYCCRAESSTTL